MVRRMILGCFLIVVLCCIFAPATAAVGAGEPAVVSWQTGAVLDQGEEPACVGYALATLLQAEPKAYSQDNSPTGMALYIGAQTRDEWWQTPHDGSSPQGGYGFLLEYGWIDRVEYTSAVTDVARFIQTEGPVTLATEWTYSMYYTDETGALLTGGIIAGYHMFTCYEYSRITNQFGCQNTWGEAFMDKGKFKLSWKGMDFLLTDPRSEFTSA